MNEQKTLKKRNKRGKKGKKGTEEQKKRNKGAPHKRSLKQHQNKN